MNGENARYALGDGRQRRARGRLRAAGGAEGLEPHPGGPARDGAPRSGPPPGAGLPRAGAVLRDGHRGSAGEGASGLDRGVVHRPGARCVNNAGHRQPGQLRVQPARAHGGEHRRERAGDHADDISPPADAEKALALRLLNVASLAAFYPMPVLAVYAATKSFILNFSLAVRAELAGTGVTVSALCPGRHDDQQGDRGRGAGAGAHREDHHTGNRRGWPRSPFARRCGKGHHRAGDPQQHPALRRVRPSRARSWWG